MRRLVLALVVALACGIAPQAFAQPQGTTEPPAPLQQVDQPRGRSGFWTSPHNAEERPYRWGKLTIGVGIAAVMGLLMWRLVRRASSDRNKRHQA